MPRSKDQSNEPTGSSRITAAISSVLVGAVTLMTGFLVLVWGEARVNIATTIENSTSLNDSDARSGAPVTYTGSLSYTRAADDGVLKGEYAYIRRRVETCAWVEKTVKKKGKESLAYKKRWIEVVPDSRRFSTRGFDNRPGPLREATAVGGGLTVGSMALTALPDVARADTIAPRMADVAQARLVDEKWAYLSAHKSCSESGAAIGDQRLRFDVLRAGDLVTVFGSRDAGRIMPFRGQLLLSRGDRSALINELSSERSTVTWFYRAGGAILLWIALYLLLRPAVALVGWLPIIGDLARGVATLMTMLAALALTLAFVFWGWGMTFFSNLFGGLVG